MATREDWLKAIGARRLRSLRPTEPLQMPSSWVVWMMSGEGTQPSSLHATPEAIAAVAAQRPASAPAAPFVPKSRWTRFRALLRQGWFRERDEPKPRRVFALSTSLLLNFLFAALLIYLMYLRFLAVSAPPPEEGLRVQIMGTGTPEEVGGGEPGAQAQGQPEPQAGNAAAAQPAAASRATAAASAMPANPMEAASPELQVAELPAEQPLQVSEPRPQEAEFQLPPTREARLPQIAARPIAERTLPATEDIPGPLPEVRDIAMRPVATRSISEPVLRVQERALPVPEPDPEPLPTPTLRSREVATRAPQLRVPELGAQRELPSPPSPSPAGSATASVPKPAGSSQGQTQPAGAADATRRASTGTQAQVTGTTPGRNATAPGAGVQPTAAPGGVPSTRRGDDWGDAARNRDGQPRGGDRGNARSTGRNGDRLFNADGSPRLADDSFKPRIPDPYKEGTWLRRPGMQVQGTIFDKAWRPPETLLEEWVRRGVKSVSIPIPGTDMELTCVVSVLQAAGGCFPTPGKNGNFDQPARARKPPAVPFKPQLMQNPGDLSTPVPQAEKKPDQL